MAKNGKPSKEPEGWLDKDANREKLKMAGVALATVVAAGWTVFLYFQPPTGDSGEFHVCQGEFQNQCKPHVFFIRCDEDIFVWANNRCSKWQMVGGNRLEWRPVRLPRYKD
jgi:hypothetical protein